jgi:hypothetical protein
MKSVSKKFDQGKLLFSFVYGWSESSKFMGSLFAIFYFLTITLRQKDNSTVLNKGAVSDDAYPLF